MLPCGSPGITLVLCFPDEISPHSYGAFADDAELLTSLKTLDNTHVRMAFPLQVAVPHSALEQGTT